LRSRCCARSLITVCTAACFSMKSRILSLSETDPPSHCYTCTEDIDCWISITHTATDCMYMCICTTMGNHLHKILCHPQPNHGNCSKHKKVNATGTNLEKHLHILQSQLLVSIFLPLSHGSLTLTIRDIVSLQSQQIFTLSMLCTVLMRPERW
jgi:hypothetical protein